MVGQTPRQGWIYMIDPQEVYLKCKLGHVYRYGVQKIDNVKCQHSSCTQTVNLSRVFRGKHPYIIWTRDQFLDESGYRQTFLAIPLTSKETYTGLPTFYPINPTTRNGLDKKSFALVHQISTVDANCFKNSDGKWKDRIGQLSKADREAIEERLKYFLNIKQSPSDDWFAKNASPELLRKVFDCLPEDIKSSALEELIDLESNIGY